MNIYSCFTGKSHAEIEKEFEGRGYGDFKLAVGEVVADGLAPLQARYNQIISDKAYLEDVMKNGARAASYRAEKTIRKVAKKVGFIPR
jgi:tryptophanyl-tRNA synthetase